MHASNVFPARPWTKVICAVHGDDYVRRQVMCLTSGQNSADVGVTVKTLCTQLRTFTLTFMKV